MDSESLRLLDFDQVLGLIGEFAATVLGKKRVREIEPFNELTVLEKCLAEKAELTRYVTEHGRIPLGHLRDTGEVLSQLEHPSAVLSSDAFLLVLDYLRFAHQVSHSFPPREYPVLAATFSGLRPPESLIQRIEGGIDENGEVRETAIPELGAVRRRLVRTRDKVNKLLSGYFKGPSSQFLIPDAFVTQRKGRFVIPVRVEHQKEIPGIVHATSSSGATVFLEPLSAIELNNLSTYLRDREADLIRRFLAELTEALRVEIRFLKEAIEQSALLDNLVACVDFGTRFRCILPAVTGDDHLVLRKAKHPLLLKTLGEEKVVAISVEVTGEENVLVISGPNTGGKTVALKTVGLLSAMSRAALPVPAEEAKVPFLADILADIGDHQSITQNLSTFSAHIVRINEIIDSFTYPALLLLDELGRGTDPIYGGALATSLIEHFQRQRALLVATTHHRAVKTFAASQPGVRNASVQLDPVSSRPTYRLEVGTAGSSSGLKIAEQLGLKGEIVDRAREQLDESEVRVEEYLDSLRKELLKLKQLEAAQTGKLSELEARRRELDLDAAKEEARRQKRFEDLLGRWAKEFKGEVSRFLRRTRDQSEAVRIRTAAKARESALKERFRRQLKGPQPNPSESPAKGNLDPGDRVYLKSLEKRGKVLTVEKNMVVVEIEGKRIKTTAKALSKITTQIVKSEPVPRVTLQVVESSDPELNLIGKTIEEALPMVDKFLDRAFLSRLSEVKIIHGFGTGRLRASITEFLCTHTHVKKYQGEGGATRVFLKT